MSILWRRAFYLGADRQRDVVRHEPCAPCADLAASSVVWRSLALQSIHGDAEIDRGASSVESCTIPCISTRYKKLAFA